MGLLNRKDKSSGAESAEQSTEQADDGIQPIEGFVDPFEDDWDDAEMRESLKEWERMLADSEEAQAGSITPGASTQAMPTDQPTMQELEP